MTDARTDPWEPPSGPPAGTVVVPPPPPPPPPAVPLRRRRGSLLVAVAVIAVVVAGAAIGVPLGLLTRGTAPRPSPGTTPDGSAGAATARTFYQQARAAAGASAGCHYVGVSRGSVGTQTIVGDAGQADGRQDITMDSTYGTEHFTLLLVAGTVYFQGNAAALRDQLGVPAAKVPGLAGSWISVSGGDGPYNIVAPGITVGDQVQEASLTPTSTTLVGAATRRIVGTVPPELGGPGPSHLDIAIDSQLPLSYASSSSANGATTTTTTRFSAWGVAPSVTAPSGSVAWATLGASEPPGGYGSGGANGSQTPQA